MKNYEKKSFFTSVYLFFIPLAIFATVVLYMYHTDKIKDLEQNILYQMKEYTFDFKSKEFILDIVEDDNTKETFKLYHCEEGLCGYFDVQSSGPYLLKVIYEQKKYDELYQNSLVKTLKISLLMVISLFIISLGFAFYSLRPMREALYLLENFLKDLIHDLNTPSTSILLNSKLLRKRGDFEEIERIELSAKTISSLYKNLEFINSSNIEKNEEVSINELIEQKIEILKKIYPNIKFKKELSNLNIKSNKNGIDRILDNILTNACKYNKKNGEVLIKISKNKVIVEDSGIGIKNVKKIYQRYYKENNRGLGIGMNIVKKLCDSLGIKIEVESVIDQGTKVELTFDI